MCTPLPIGPDLFVWQQWTEIIPNEIVSPDGTFNTTLTYIQDTNVNAISKITIELQEHPSNEFLFVIDNGISVKINHVYYIRYGSRDCVLFLLQGTDNSFSQYADQYYGFYLYTPIKNTVTHIGATGVFSSQGIKIFIDSVYGSVFLVSSHNQKTSPYKASGVLYRSDSGDFIPGGSASMNIFDPDAPGDILARVTNNWIQLFFDDPNADPISEVQIPCIIDEDNFYLRDWTEDSSNGDDGSEPSTSPDNFYTTGDVWNQDIPNDPQISAVTDIPGLTNAVIGGTDNYAYVRVWRKAPGYDFPQVTVNFLTALFGSGSNFMSVGTETLVIPSDFTTGYLPSQGLLWTPPEIVTNHYCIAAEIATINDPLISSLNGVAPGSHPDQGDIQIINENNKAQRNLQISLQMAQESESNEVPIPSYALIHNGSIFTRNIEIEYKPDNDLDKQSKGMLLEVIGGNAAIDPKAQKITLRNMQPGENRWISLSLQQLKGEVNQQLTVNFNETSGGRIFNGFAITVLISEPKDVMRTNITLHLSTINRMISMVDQTRNFDFQRDFGEVELTEKGYLTLLDKTLLPIKKSISQLINDSRIGDPFSLESSIDLLSLMIENKNIKPILLAHTSLLNRLDTFSVMVQIKDGNVADILQNVRWQRRLFDEIPSLSETRAVKHIIVQSDEFIRNWRPTANDYTLFSNLLKNLIPYFEEVVKILLSYDEGIQGILTQIREQKDFKELQNAHRMFLLKLEEFIH